MTPQGKKQSKIHVVLIEDNAATAAAIASKIAEIKEYRLSHYLSGEEFFTRFNFRTAPDIFLIDSFLDDASGKLLDRGVDIVARLKEIKKFKNIPVLMLSANPDEPDHTCPQLVNTFYYQQKISGLKAGAADVIYIPDYIDIESDPSLFPIDELLHKIRILTQRRFSQLELRRKPPASAEKS